MQYRKKKRIPSSQIVSIDGTQNSILKCHSWHLGKAFDHATNFEQVQAVTICGLHLPL